MATSALMGINKSNRVENQCNTQHSDSSSGTTSLEPYETQNDMAAATASQDLSDKQQQEVDTHAGLEIPNAEDFTQPGRQSWLSQPDPGGIVRPGGFKMHGGVKSRRPGGDATSPRNTEMTGMGGVSSPRSASLLGTTGVAHCLGAHHRPQLQEQHCLRVHHRQEPQEKCLGASTVYKSKRGSSPRGASTPEFHRLRLIIKT